MKHLTTRHRIVIIWNGARLCCLLLLLLPAISLASVSGRSSDSDQPTFYKDVLSVLQQNCQNCHREGGANLGGMVAPMAFGDYQQTRPWARSIARQVEARTMPPWHASADQTGHFANERGLSESEIETLKDWVVAGAPAGDPADAPPTRQWPDLSEWSIGEPDLVVEMPVEHLVADHVEDEYKYFRHTLTNEQLPEDRWIAAYEFKPGSPAVHHIILQPIGGIAPGTDAVRYAPGVGRKLSAGSQLTWEMHYHKEPGPGTAVTDRSRLAIKFYPKDTHVPFPLRDAEMGNYDFEIPPGTAGYSAQSSYRFRRDSQIVSFSPHMHLRGTAANYVAKFPDGRTETLLEVPRYDFNWQTTYTYKDPKRVPEGTIVTVTTVWDNSPENLNNPDPSQTVRYGEPTTDEMSFGFIEFIDAKPAKSVASADDSPMGHNPKTGWWFHQEHQVAIKIPKRLSPSGSSDSLASFASAQYIPSIDIDIEPTEGTTFTTDLLASLLVELYEPEMQGLEIESKHSTTLADGTTPAMEVVMLSDYAGYPLRTLVLAVEHNQQLVTVAITVGRRASMERLREMASSLRVGQSALEVATQ